jgi:hypothetical protein
MADELYVSDSWSGLPHYACVACGYDTLLAPRITEHVASCPATLALTPATATSPEPPQPPPEPEPEPEPVPVPDDPDEDEEGAPA